METNYGKVRENLSVRKKVIILDTLLMCALHLIFSLYFRSSCSVYQFDGPYLMDTVDSDLGFKVVDEPSMLCPGGKAVST